MDTYPKNPNIDVVNYVFELSLTDDSNEIIGEATIDLRFLTNGTSTVRLDLIRKSSDLEEKGMTVSAVTMAGKSLSFVHQEDALFINLPDPSSVNQRSQIQVSYRGVPASGLKIAPNKYGDRGFFSDNWPNRARNWLPSIDHPYDKAKVEFIVTAPDHYQVISNGLRVEETDLGNGTRLTHWRHSVPIASWLYVLGVARFAVQHVDDYDGISISTWVYPQDRDAGFYDFAVPTKAAMAFYSDMVGPYSYEKLDNIQSNSVGGGMEAASAIFYGDKSVTGDRSERWRNVIIHEVAHQWFGNAVTEYDWDDVWLSEGFATYFTLLFIEHAYGKDEFMKGLKASKLRVDNFQEENPDYRIVHDNLDDMSKVSSGNTYQKGAWILHMLRGMMGDDAFWAGIQSYYAEFQDKNARTTDFRRHMEEASGLDLEKFFDQWLYKPGTMKVEWDWKYNEGEKSLEISMSQPGDIFQMPIQVGISSKDGSPQVQTINLDSAEQDFKIKLDAAPEEVVLDPNHLVLMLVNPSEME